MPDTLQLVLGWVSRGVTNLWPWSHRQCMSCSYLCSSHAASFRQFCCGLWGDIDVSRAGRRQASRSCSATIAQLPWAKLYVLHQLQCLMHQDLSNLLQPGPSAIPSAPHQLQYVSSGLLPFWYLAVQAKKSGNK